VAEHAMSADGEFGFSRWVMHGTGARGPFELVGMDRTRVRDGLVCENYVFFDLAHFEEVVGGDGECRKEPTQVAPLERPEAR
jgi:hypothetical protein